MGHTDYDCSQNSAEMLQKCALKTINRQKQMQHTLEWDQENSLHHIFIREHVFWRGFTSNQAHNETANLSMRNRSQL